LAARAAGVGGDAVPALDVALGNLRRLGAYAAGVVEALGGREDEDAGVLVQPEDLKLLAALAAVLGALRGGDAHDAALDAADAAGRALC
jgi:hypothetical protein